MKKIAQCSIPDSTHKLRMIARRDLDSAGTLKIKDVMVITKILMALLELVCTVKMVALVRRAMELAGLILSTRIMKDVKALGFMSI
jgi:hypothetical protein